MKTNFTYRFYAYSMHKSRSAHSLFSVFIFLIGLNGWGQEVTPPKRSEIPNQKPAASAQVMNMRLEEMRRTVKSSENSATTAASDLQLNADEPVERDEFEAKIMNPDSLESMPTEPIHKEVVYSTTDAFTLQPEELMLKSQPQRTVEGPLDGDNRVQENTKFLHSEWSENGLFHPYKPSDEVTQLRTEHSKTFKNFDGSFTALMLSDIHYLNENNEWKEIDSRLIKDVDNTNTTYDLVNTTNRFHTSFTSNNAAQGYSITKNKVTAKFGTNVQIDIVDNAGGVIANMNRTNSTNSAIIDDRIVRYNDAFSGGIDQEFVTLKRGVEHGFLLNNPATFAAYAGNKIRISEKIELPQDAIVLFNNDKVVQGMVTAKDFTIQLSDGSVYAKYLPVVIYDGSVSYKEILMLAETPSSYFESQYDKEGRVIDRSSIFITSDYTLQLIGNELVVSYNVPTTWLLDANRTFPVYVDPTNEITALTLSHFAGNGDPYNTYFHDARYQSLVLGSELDAVGITSTAIISRMDFAVYAQPGLAVNNFRVRLQNTANTTSTAFVTSGWTNVVGPVNAGQPAAGFWQNHVFSTNFNRSSSNLLIDISRDNTAWNWNGGMYVRGVATNRGRVGFSDSYSTWPFDAIANQSNYNYIPAVRITYTIPCPTGLLQSNTITANGSTGPITVCPGVPITIASSGGEAGSGWAYWATSNGYASWNVLDYTNLNQSSFTFTPTTPGTYYFNVYNYDICGFWCWDAERGANCSLISSVQVNVVSPTTYYSKSTGNLNDLSTWGSNADGTGCPPDNFTTAGVTYNVHNNATPTTSSAWTVSGAGSLVKVGNNSSAITFLAGANLSFDCDLEITGNATLNINTRNMTLSGDLIRSAITAGFSQTPNDAPEGSTVTFSGSSQNINVTSNNGTTPTDSDITFNHIVISGSDVKLFYYKINDRKLNINNFTVNTGKLVTLYSNPQ